MWSVLDTGSAITTAMKAHHRKMLKDRKKGAEIELYDGKRIKNTSSFVKCFILGNVVRSVSVNMPEPGQDGNMYTEYSFLGTNALKGLRLTLKNMSVLREPHGVPQVFVE